MEVASAFSPYWVLKTLSMTQNPFCPPDTKPRCMRILEITIIVCVNNAPLKYTHRSLHFSYSNSDFIVNQKYADTLSFCKSSKKDCAYAMRIFLGVAETCARISQVRRHGVIFWSSHYSEFSEFGKTEILSQCEMFKLELIDEYLRTTVIGY